MNIIRDGITSLRPVFRFLITGRPEEDILALNSSPNVQSLLLDPQSDESKQNIPTYIEYELGRLRSSNMLRVPSDWPWNESLRTLSQTANGLFIWASTAVKFVSEEKLNRLGRLERLVRNASSLNLDDLYITVLENALQWDDYASDLFKGVFSLIFFSKSPLFTQDITGILGLQEDTISNLLSCLRSLVACEDNQTIKIHHTSFYDFLVSCVGRPWYIDVETQKTSIITRCFDRMKELLRYNMCGLETSLVFNKDVPNLGERIKENIPSFLKYVCCNWFNHTRDVSYSQDLCEQLKSFAQHQLLFWFEVLSLTEAFSDHIGAALVYTIQWVGVGNYQLLLLYLTHI